MKFVVICAMIRFVVFRSLCSMFPLDSIIESVIAVGGALLWVSSVSEKNRGTVIMIRRPRRVTKIEPTLFIDLRGLPGGGKEQF